MVIFPSFIAYLVVGPPCGLREGTGEQEPVEQAIVLARIQLGQNLRLYGSVKANERTFQDEWFHCALTVYRVRRVAPRFQVELPIGTLGFVLVHGTHPT